MSRKPLAVHFEPNTEEHAGSVFVLCDDGSFFGYSWEEGTWVRYASIPGTPAETKEEELEQEGKRKAEESMREGLQEAARKKYRKR
jgi:hypothetical protein